MLKKIKKHKVKILVGSALTILASLLGYQSLTIEDVYRFFSQNGGTYVEEIVMDRPVVDTGLIEDIKTEDQGTPQPYEPKDLPT